MNITIESLDDIGRDVMLDDLPFDKLNDNQIVDLFNCLPHSLKGQIVSWGWNDSVVRDDLFVLILKKMFYVTPEEWYSKSIKESKNYFDNNKTVNFDEYIKYLKKI